MLIESSSSALQLIQGFPVSISSSFDLNSYNKQFEDRSFIVSAKDNHIEYPNHWGVLSVKSAFRGTEYYESGNAFYAVDDSNFLIFNEGTYRSSYISSKEKVESFSISFSPSLVRSFLFSILSTDDRILDNPFYQSNETLRFTEKLYPHNELVSPLIFKILTLLEDWDTNYGKVEEMLSFLLEGLVLNQKQVWFQMGKVNGIRTSTQRELFERLNRAKDFIYSRYKETLTTESIANVACLNRHYFLREFKKVFQTTPHQYLQNLRMMEAKRLLETTNKQVTEICNEIGYTDLASFSKLYKKYFNRNPTDSRFKLHASYPAL